MLRNKLYYKNQKFNITIKKQPKLIEHRKVALFVLDDLELIGSRAVNLHRKVKRGSCFLKTFRSFMCTMCCRGIRPELAYGPFRGWNSPTISWDTPLRTRLVECANGSGINGWDVVLWLSLPSSFEKRKTDLNRYQDAN